MSSAQAETPAPTAGGPRDGALLQVRDLTTTFPVRGQGVFRRVVGRVQAVSGVSLDVDEGETLGVVGESGCGKSTTGRSILQLVRPDSGSVRYDGRELVGLSPKEMRPLRRELAMVFQDPFGSLDPRLPVSELIAEPLRIHQVSSDESALRARVEELLGLVGLEPEHRSRYSHEFSGGQRQRIGIARALAANPRLIVLDEPVSALDVSVQAGVVNLLEDLQERLGLSYLFIAHDLSVVRHISDRVAVMYLGKVVEVGDAASVYDNPAPPLHAGAALGRAAGGPLGGAAATEVPRGAHRGDPQPRGPAVGLPVPHPLPEGAGSLRRGGTAAHPVRRGRAAHVRLPLPGRRRGLGGIGPGRPWRRWPIAAT